MKEYEIALIILEMYYSFPNIDKSNNFFSYSSNLDPLWVGIIIPVYKAAVALEQNLVMGMYNGKVWRNRYAIKMLTES